MKLKYGDLIIDKPGIWFEPERFKKWVVAVRVFNQDGKLELTRRHRFFLKCSADSYLGHLMHNAAWVPKVDRTPPEGYGWQQSKRGNKGEYYYLTEQPNYYGATPLFMVMEYSPGRIAPMAENCYKNHACLIVDGLRLQQGYKLSEPTTEKGFPFNG